MQEKQEKDEFRFGQVRRSVLKDAKILKDRFRGEAKGNFPAHPPRFSLPTALFLYSVYSLAVYGAVIYLFSVFTAAYPLRAAICAALAMFAAGNCSILCAFYCKKRFGALVEMLLTSAIRTGVPLTVALVFYFAVDKISQRSAILTVAAFYVLAFPFEVWLALPARRAEADGRDTTK